MNFTSYRLLAILVTLASGNICAHGNVFAPYVHKLGGAPLVKECIKEIPVNRYETLGEQKLFAPQGVNVLDGQDVVEMLVDSTMRNNGDPKALLQDVTKIYVREKVLNLLSAQAPEMPDKVQENPNLQYTLILSLKTAARFGLEFAIDSIIGTLYNLAKPQDDHGLR